MISPIDRRRFLQYGAGLAALMAAAPRLGAAARASASGPIRELTLRAAETTVKIGDGSWRTWAYNGQVPGPEIRVSRGDRIRIRLDNRLPEPTTIHWHGLVVPPDMDGVPVLSQPAVPPGGTFTYEFDATLSGTFFYHSHVGLQLDRGLYGALIVEEPGEREALRIDREYVLVLDDWLTVTPEEALRSIAGFGGMMGGGPAYAGYLLNGTTVPSALAVTRGERVRLRLVNGASATVFRLGIAGHTLRVTHADGQPVAPLEVSTLMLGMGERYDVLVDASNPGTWPILIGPASGAATIAAAALTYSGFERPLSPTPVWPVGLQGGRTLRYADLRPASPTDAGMTQELIRIPIVLTGGMGAGTAGWAINGQRYPNSSPLVVREGARVQIEMVNRSMMPHPMHLHGHMGRLLVPGYPSPTIAKDTVLLNALETVTLEFLADNPGRWLFHCHNLYHMELGMARVVDYE